MPEAIEAVLFDLDDTLLDTDAGWAAGMDAILRRCPHIDRAAALTAWTLAFDAHYDRFLRGELTFDECCIARIRTWGEKLSLGIAPGEELAWFADYAAGYHGGSMLFPDVADCLRGLSGVKLGVITNGDRAQQRAKATSVGLIERFDVFLASSELGFPKPDRRIFEAAARHIDAAPRRCLFVGDRRDIDAEGAIAAGMRGVWLNRSGVGTIEADDGVVEINSLALVRELLTAP